MDNQRWFSLLVGTAFTFFAFGSIKLSQTSSIIILEIRQLNTLAESNGMPGDTSYTSKYIFLCSLAVSAPISGMYTFRQFKYAFGYEWPGRKGDAATNEGNTESLEDGAID
jgi:hypothetical protein